MLTAAPGRECPDSHLAEIKARHCDVELAAFLRQKTRGRVRSQDNNIFGRVMCRGLVMPRRIRFGHRATVRGSPLVDRRDRWVYCPRRGFDVQAVTVT
jgi:hypothetical protein